jgi:hypothetical protein
MEFELLMIHCKLIEPQEQTIAWFIGALRKDIANVVELQPYIFLVGVIKLVTRIERQQKKGSFRAGITTLNASKSISTSSRTWNAPKKDEKVGFSKESISSDFTKGKEKVTKPQHPKKSRDIKCFKCLRHGHITFECSNKRVMVVHKKHGELVSSDEVETEIQDEI